MTVGSVSKPSLRERATEELIEFSVLFVYLYISLGALILMKSAILQEAGVSFTIWGIAAVKALLLAKFMLIGRALHIGEVHKNKPLIYPTLYKSLAFLLLLLALTAIEEVLVGLIHHRPLADSMAHIVGPTLLQGLATCIIMFLILLPYFAFRCVQDVLGHRYLVDLFLKGPNRLAPPLLDSQTPPSVTPARAH